MLTEEDLNQYSTEELYSYLDNNLVKKTQKLTIQNIIVSRYKEMNKEQQIESLLELNHYEEYELFFSAMSSEAAYYLLTKFDKEMFVGKILNGNLSLSSYVFRNIVSIIDDEQLEKILNIDLKIDGENQIYLDRRMAPYELDKLIENGITFDSLMSFWDIYCRKYSDLKYDAHLKDIKRRTDLRKSIEDADIKEKKEGKKISRKVFKNVYLYIVSIILWMLASTVLPSIISFFSIIPIFYLVYTHNSRKKELQREHEYKKINTENSQRLELIEEHSAFKNAETTYINEMNFFKLLANYLRGDGLLLNNGIYHYNAKSINRIEKNYDYKFILKHCELKNYAIRNVDMKNLSNKYPNINLLDIFILIINEFNSENLRIDTERRKISEENFKKSEEEKRSKQMASDLSKLTDELIRKS